MDFYNRSSLTAYCTAFAYRPLNTKLYTAGASARTGSTSHSESLFHSSGAYLELPADSSHLYQPERSPTPAGSTHFSMARIRSDGNLYYSTSVPTGSGIQHDAASTVPQAHSNDSLFGAESPEELPADTPEGLFHLQCNQIFVAMVTMQYQARTDMVQLIEQLDRASIRFVHFSKENELRSRVFSEKMGLESGWNCHISLLSDAAATGGDGGGRTEDLVDNGKRRLNKSIISLTGKESAQPAGKEEVVYVPLAPRSSNNPFLAPLEAARPLSISAPSAINVEMAQVKFEDEISLHNLTDDSDDNSDLPKDDERERLFHSPKSPDSIQTPSPQRHHLVNCSSHGSSLDSCSTSSSSSSVLLNVAGSIIHFFCIISLLYRVVLSLSGGGSSCWDVNLSLTRSQSHVTESTEQSAPVAFDLSNRVIDNDPLDIEKSMNNQLIS